MNIFKLDIDTQRCVEYHCDKHVVKMILEYAQLLSTAHHELDGDQALPGIYKRTHFNHPSAIWARETSGNYIWLQELALALCKEYTYRYGRVHKTEAIIDRLYIVPANIAWANMTELTQCMPDHHKRANPVEGYRTYYRAEKFEMATYKKRDVPFFMGP